jgi:hypothetical protein
MFRPHAGESEPIQRPNAALIRKLKAEGNNIPRMEKCTRTITISLPPKKVKAWSSAIKRLIKSKSKLDYATLATTVGRLNHVAHIIPEGRHFLNRLRYEETKNEQTNTDSQPYPTKQNKTKQDSKLWIKFLKYAEKGISINTIIFRSPTSLSLSDACETGMGGYNL